MSTLDTEHFSPYRADGKLYGFVCVITGAQQPVGQAIIQELAAKEEETLGLIDDVLNSWGRLDVWVCSSGSLGPSSIDATTPTDLQKCFEANSMAPFFALKYAPPAMTKTTPKLSYPNAAPKDQKYGSIIVVSSVASTYGGCWGPAFTMASHAALGVVRAGVAVLKGTGIRINCISPGQIHFDMRGMASRFPPASLQTKESQKAHIGLEPAGLPIEVGRVAGFLVSGFSSYITGANMVVDEGARFLSIDTNIRVCKQSIAGYPITSEPAVIAQTRVAVIAVFKNSTIPLQPSNPQLPTLLFPTQHHTKENSTMSTPQTLSSTSPSDVSSACETHSLTAHEFHSLHTGCVVAKSTAYCPYSQFRVGCTLLTASGQYVSGANVENAAYPVGTCAERVAFGKAVTEGHREGFRAVAVATDISPPASPCGMCRQL
ncbi:hypothetical protein HYALB_00012210 [Hymenoscyphus albidus]|uniref:Peroxisomal trans-2-enoyl-CoA reductase n=1 Tax=Hymenoscyphus albidus TaxID=595503 RepID=A0A9N9Q3Y3_9HELO|nr:hypothetical protein HYALB_00012210 [Hymenoscyphus albidus]